MAFAHSLEARLSFVLDFSRVFIDAAGFPFMVQTARLLLFHEKSFLLRFNTSSHPEALGAYYMAL